MEQQETICLAIVRIIRERSETGQLAQSKEILAELIGQGLLKSESGDERHHFETVLKEAVEKNEDIKEISGSDGIPCYYSALNLSETYTRILIQKKENPLTLMAEIVRENSSIYPRPVPLDIFKESPFDFTQDELLVYLKKWLSRESIKTSLKQLLLLAQYFFTPPGTLNQITHLHSLNG